VVSSLKNGYKHQTELIETFEDQVENDGLLLNGFFHVVGHDEDKAYRQPKHDSQPFEGMKRLQQGNPEE
jgi:hypothetical protein